LKLHSLQPDVIIWNVRKDGNKLNKCFSRHKLLHTFGINSDLLLHSISSRITAWLQSEPLLFLSPNSSLATTKKIVIASKPVTYARDRFLRNQRNSKWAALSNVRITNGVSKIGQPDLNSFVILPRLHRRTAALKLFNSS